MRKPFTLFAAACWTLVAGGPPLSLYPANPHYFLFRGKPAVLVTSGEHYGAVLNLDFDGARYLRTLAKDRLNLTRIFVGNYREGPGMFNIGGNTLAPLPGKFVSPWKEQDGKFDLTQWNPAFFARLRAFITEASRRGIIVEVNLFCPMYEEGMWDLSPMNAKNNVNGIGAVKRTDVLALKDDRLTAVQDDLVRKIVSELRDFDNIYYEICNEPYFGGVTAEWQRHISRTIADAEAAFPYRHLISQNIANGSKKVEDPDPLVSIFNFHYAHPPRAVAQNYGLNKLIGCNETGFDGNSDAIYRIQGWDFLMAGGALYNNLDYSFTVGHEDGSFAVPPTNPGWGSVAFRKQMGILRAFFDRLDLAAVAPAAAIEANGASARGMDIRGRLAAAYIHRGRAVKDGKPKFQVDTASRATELAVNLQAGRYRLEWMDPKTGRRLSRGVISHPGGEVKLKSPVFSEDVVLRVL